MTTHVIWSKTVSERAADTLIQQQADDVWQKFSQQVIQNSAKEPPTPARTDAGEMARVWSLLDMGITDRELQVGIVATLYSNSPRGSFGKVFLSPVIMLYQKADPSKFWPTFFQAKTFRLLTLEKLRVTFVHEYTHYYDENRAKGTMKASADHATFADYVNSDEELNAWFTGMTRAVLDMLEELSWVRFTQVSPDDYDNVLGKTFPEFIDKLRKFREYNYTHAMRDMTPANQRRQIKRLFPVWKEWKSQAAKGGPFSV